MQRCHHPHSAQPTSGHRKAENIPTCIGSQDGGGPHATAQRTPAQRSNGKQQARHSDMGSPQVGQALLHIQARGSSKIDRHRAMADRQAALRTPTEKGVGGIDRVAPATLVAHVQHAAHA